MTIKHFVTQIRFWPLSWLSWSLLADSAGLKFHGYPGGIQPQRVSGTLSSWEKKTKQNMVCFYNCACSIERDMSVLSVKLGRNTVQESSEGEGWDTSSPCWFSP